jgi:hypothetical protein
MKKMLRFGMAAAVIGMLAVAPMASRAQGGPCFPGLSTEDCELLAKADTMMPNMFAIDSYDVAVNVTLGSNVVADIKATGSGVLDASKVVVDPADQASVFKGLIFALTADGAVNAQGQNQAGKLEVRIVDGILYINDGTKWQKTSVEDALNSSGAAMPVNPSTAGDLANNPAILGALQSLSAIPDFIKVTVADGESVDDKATKVFTFEVSLAALVNGITSPEFKPQLQALFQLAGQEVTDQQLAQLTQITTIFQPVLDATTINFVRTIATDGTPYGLELRFSTTVDQTVGALLQLTEEAKVDISFKVQISKVGQPVTVEVPADAVEIGTN